MNTKCYVVYRQDVGYEDYVRVFLSRAEAEAAIKEEMKIEEANMRANGYEPSICDYGDGAYEVYAPGESNNARWTLSESRIDGMVIE